MAARVWWVVVCAGLLVMHHHHTHHERLRTHPVMPELWRVFVFVSMSVSVTEWFDSVFVAYRVCLGYRDS